MIRIESQSTSVRLLEELEQNGVASHTSVTDTVLDTDWEAINNKMTTRSTPDGRAHV